MSRVMLPLFLFLLALVLTTGKAFVDNVVPMRYPKTPSNTTLGSDRSRRWKHRLYPISTDMGQLKQTFAKVTQLKPSTQVAHITKFVAECDMPTDLGHFRMRSFTYTSQSQNLEPIVMISGDVEGKANVLVRVHDQCLTSEVFGSLRCDCQQQLHESLRMIQDQGGVVIYLQQEGRGIGIANKVAAYGLQDTGMDTVDANIHLGFSSEMREYRAVPDILKNIGVQSIRLMTNNPYKIRQLSDLGVQITERVPIEMDANAFNEAYLRSKRERMDHILVKNLQPYALPDTKIKSPVYSMINANTREGVVKKPSASLLKAAAVKGGRTTHEQQTVNNHNAESPTDDFSTPKGYVFGRKSVEDAIAAVKRGEIVLVVDDAARENEGDLIMAAALATPEKIGFMVRHSSGVLCVSLESDRLAQLKLPPMVTHNQDPKKTAYSISADYKHGTSTGISAHDRALTFRKLVDKSATAEDFYRPGHVFPLQYKEGGTLTRAGHTEASLDLTRMAGLPAGGVLVEVVHDDGSMQRLPDLEVMSKKYGIILTSVQDIIAYRAETELGIQF